MSGWGSTWRPQPFCVGELVCKMIKTEFWPRVCPEKMNFPSLNGTRSDKVFNLCNSLWWRRGCGCCEDQGGKATPT